jgi:hypothetical protein
MAYYTASRAGLRVLVTPVKPDLHRKLKVRAAETDSTLEQVCRIALERYLDSL